MLIAPVCALGGEAAGGRTFEDETSVLLIEVPVQVLVDGEPVRGLGRENFRLYDNGKRREIFSFEVLDFSRRAAQETLPISSRGGPAIGARRHFLFLVDFAYPDSWDPRYGAGPITAAVHGMKDTADRLDRLFDSGFHPDDRLAFAYLSPLRGVRLLQGWTDDRTAARRTLELLRAVVELEPERVRELWREQGRDAEPAARAGGAAPWATLEDLVAEAATAGARADPYLPHGDLVSKLFEGLIRIARALGDAPGPRHVVYLSTGFPQASLDELRIFVRELRRRHWSIQSIYTGGPGMGPESLFLLSHETGGQLFTNSHDVDVLLADMVEETAVTYALTFEAETGGRRSAHRKLRVELVDGPRGARVIHRRGYYAPGADDGG